MADLLGGTSGQILAKNSNTDMDFVWIANDQGDITGITASSPLTGGGTSGAVTVGIQDALTTQKGAVQLSDSTSTTSSILAATPTAVKSAYDLADAAISKSLIDAAGDLIVGTADNTAGRLGIGTAGQVLKVNSGATALEWGTAGGGSTFSGCSVYNTGNQSQSNGSDLTVLFSDEFFDTDSFHSTSTNTGRLTIPSGKNGKYLVSCIVAWSVNSNGARVIQILKNGTAQIARASSPGLSGEGLYLSCFGIFDLVATDFVSLQVYQNSGSTLDVLGGNDKTLFNIVYLGA
jgi:hypothetical protein